MARPVGQVLPVTYTMVLPKHGVSLYLFTNVCKVERFQTPARNHSLLTHVAHVVVHEQSSAL